MFSSGDSKILSPKSFYLISAHDKMQRFLSWEELNGASIALTIASCRFEGGVFCLRALMKHHCRIELIYAYYKESAFLYAHSDMRISYIIAICQFQHTSLFSKE